MKPCIALLSVVLALPSYTRLKLHERIAIADLMVTGTIVEVREETVLVEVAKVGFGTPAAPRIAVLRFRDWTCAARWEEYAVGQHCLYYLAASKAPGSPYGILGAGGEGERPLGPEQQVDLQWDLREIGGSIAVDDLMTEARRYREHFRFLRRGGAGCLIERACSEEDLTAYVDSSPLARALSRHTFAGAYRDPEARSPAPKGTLTRWDLGLGVLPKAVAALPDLDGDGIDELVCAQESPWIVYPRADGEPRRERFAGDGAFESDCTSLAYLGDLDGDGAFELAAGDPRASNGGAFRGVVRVFSVGAKGKLERSSSFALSDPAFGGVEVAFAGFGDSLAALGDLDGDGRSELAVSESPNNWGPGQAWVVFLDSQARPARASRLLEEGQAPAGRLQLAALGDLDRDGIGDLALGAGNESDLRLFFLERDGRPRAVVDHFRPGPSQRSFGAALAALGDVDGDGTIELAVGSDKGVHVLSLSREGAVLAERELRTPSESGESLPEWSRFGGVLAAWPRAGHCEIVVGGLSWTEEPPPGGWMPRWYPSLWRIDPRRALQRSR